LEEEDLTMYHDESGWIKGLRIIAWINFITGIIGAFVTAWQLAQMFGDPLRWGIFFTALIGMFIATFIITAGIMVFLDMASDISATKRISYHMFNVLKQNGCDVPSEIAEDINITTETSESKDGFYLCPHCGNEVEVEVRDFCQNCKKFTGL